VKVSLADDLNNHQKKRLDGLFGQQGLVRGDILEVSGVAGAGKSQLALQLCLLSLQKYRDLSVIYMDSGDSFSLRRCMQMLRHSDLLRHPEPLCAQSNGRTEGQKNAAHQDLLLLQRLHVVKRYDMEQLVAYILSLQYLMDQDRRLLLVVDSLAALYAPILPSNQFKCKRCNHFLFFASPFIQSFPPFDLGSAINYQEKLINSEISFDAFG
jgi:RecA/RadA recombinase